MELPRFCYPFFMRKTIAVSVLLASVLALSACSKDAAPLPEGVQTVSGTLQAVPLSLKRRGTHALLNTQGTIAAYVESRSVDLTELDGHDVVLRGTYEKNLSDDLPPVLVVETVLEGGQEGLRPWTIPALKLSMKLPKSWQGSLKGSVATFTGSGGNTVVLEVRTADMPAQGVSSSASSQASRDTFTVGLRRVSAQVSIDERQWIVKTEPKDGNERAVVFTFAFVPERPMDEQIAQFKKLLKTAEFGFAPAASAAMSAQSSAAPFVPGGSSASAVAGEGTPCGGPAGILCPAGFYCRITDTTIEAGVCAKR
jgi:hypothetical protein